LKAVLFHEHGDLDVLRYEEFPAPEPAEDEVLVKVKAGALNRLDLWVREGLPGLRLEMPHIPGCDVSGIVAGFGERVEGFSEGERVVVNPSLSCGRCEYCIRGQDSLCVTYKILGEHVRGGYAEYVAVPATNVYRLPDDFGFDEAAAFPLAFMTAWRMLMTRARVRAGEDVLILGVGGGVSSAAVQIAKLAGARVFATSSSDAKLERAAGLGADVLVNYTKEDFGKRVWEETGKRGVDVVVENVGEATWEKSLRALAKGGRLVTCGATTGSSGMTNIPLLFWRQLDILGSTMASRSEFEEMMKLVFRRQLIPVVDKVYPLEEAREAQRRLADGRQFGKIILNP
jgi:NADPH:quinone reductase-like Zn-dependent oxidoreductase